MYTLNSRYLIIYSIKIYSMKTNYEIQLYLISKFRFILLFKEVILRSFLSMPCCLLYNTVLY